jgi:hypothetical protein
LFVTWWKRHQDRPIALRDLDDDVRHLIDPQGRGRPYISAQLEKLTGTRIAGLGLTRQPPAGKWGAATDAMKRTGDGDPHRDHRGHPPADGTDAPDAPDAIHPVASNDKTPLGEIRGGDRSGTESLFDERAAIMEFDGGMTRAEAEQRAADEITHLQTGRGVLGADDGSVERPNHGRVDT